MTEKRQAVRIMAVDQDRITGAFVGRLGVRVLDLGPTFPLNGQPFVKLVFVILDEDGQALVSSQEITLDIDQTASMSIYHEDEEVGLQWVQDVKLAANNDAAMNLLRKALEDAGHQELS